MQRLLSKYRVILSCGFFLLLSLFLAAVNTRAPYRIDPVGVLLLEVMHPLQVGATAVGQRAEWVWDRYVALWAVREQNEALRQRLEALEGMAQQTLELGLTNRRLEKLLALREELGVTAVAAHVVGRSPVAWVQTVILDKGESHGLTKGMAVLVPEGVVGRVVSVSTHTARVQLVSDATSGVDALVQRTRAHGIVAGSIDGGCALKYVQRGDEVQVGDQVVTSGLDGVFPKGQLIGTVARVGMKDSRMFQDVEVMLSAELSKVEEVLVVAPDVVRAGE
jgi:rod shape-determining protein MreC